MIQNLVAFIGRLSQKYFYFLLIALLSVAVRSANAEVIRSFQTDVHLQKDATLDITETIAYDFGNARKHGMFRDIPIRYKRHGNTYRYKFKIVSITDEHGVPLPYKASNEGVNKRIKIGDPAMLITGLHVYKIHYTVSRAVNFFAGAPEVYWNATGNDWKIPINAAEARFFPPKDVDLSAIKTDSFWGVYGSTDHATIHVKKDKGYISFLRQNLSSRQGLTFVARLPEGSVMSPSGLLLSWWFLQDWWAAFFLPLATSGAFLHTYLRDRRGSNRRKPVVVEWYPPQDLSPAEVGTLVNEKCDVKAIFSTLLDLAARGYIQIKEDTQKVPLITSVEYLFIRLPNPAGDVLAPHEHLFLEGMFDAWKFRSRTIGAFSFNDFYRKDSEKVAQSQVRLTELKNEFYQVIPSLKSRIYESLIHKKFLVDNPESSRNVYLGVGIVAIVLGILSWAISASWGWGMIAAGVITLLCRRIISSKTEAGNHELRACLGFAQFVRMVEKPRLKMMQNENPQIFGRLLPYAMALGVADEWAEGFEGLLSQSPNWYLSAGGNTEFSARSFMSDLQSGMSSISSAMQSSPSGGSGFSGGGGAGGGGGGGGGGSW